MKYNVKIIFKQEVKRSLYQNYYDVDKAKQKDGFLRVTRDGWTVAHALDNIQSYEIEEADEDSSY